LGIGIGLRRKLGSAGTVFTDSKPALCSFFEEQGHFTRGQTIKNECRLATVAGMPPVEQSFAGTGNRGDEIFPEGPSRSTEEKLQRFDGFFAANQFIDGMVLRERREEAGLQFFTNE